MQQLPFSDTEVVINTTATLNEIGKMFQEKEQAIYSD